MHSNLQNSLLAITTDIVGTLYLDNNCYAIALMKNDSDHPEQLGSFTEICRFKINEKIYLILSEEQTIPTREIDPMKVLTERELQIALLVASGKQNKHIAKQLNISEWTVSTHLRRIFMKLGVGSRAAMVYRCSSLINLYKKSVQNLSS